MSSEGLELYVRGEQAWARREVNQAALLLEQACSLLPGHGAAHHLWGKALAELGESQRAEGLQQRSCELDPGLGWNWFALAELQEQRQHWVKAAENYRCALAALPQEGWIEELAISALQRQVLGGEELSQGLGPSAYRFWCEQLEPRLPSELVPVRQSWWIHPDGQECAGALPTQGWLVVLGPGCCLRPRALQALEAWLGQCTSPLQSDLLTVDEDRFDTKAGRFDPWFKAESLHEQFWVQPWLHTISIWRCAWLRSQGLSWPPPTGEARQRWLWAALALQPSHSHVPSVLMHQRAEIPPVDRWFLAVCVRSYLETMGERVTDVKPHASRATGLQISWAVPAAVCCTAIVPTRNRAELLQQCLASVEVTTVNSSVSLRWIVVDNGSDEQALGDCLAAWQMRLGPRLTVLRDDQPFNWSALNNRAAQQSRTDLLLFLNNDIEAVSGDWLDKMAAQASRPVVGCVGAQLLYPDGCLQHAGVVVGLCGGADHAYRALAPDHSVHRGRSGLLSDWGAVTGAALMVRRELFHRFGGFDPQLPVEFNDVDFCLRLAQQGYRHVIDPEAVLIHHESQSRDAQGSSTAEKSLRLMQQRWLTRMKSTAPWWPQACSSQRADGRPKELDIAL